jgi:asparagine synthase (glutamine-hydrolysing)
VEVVAVGCALVARWAMPPVARIDRPAACVVEGDARGIDRLVGVADLADATAGAAFDALAGDFALVRALEDGLLLARGRFGGRSLYYAIDRDGRAIVVCSRLAPLARMGARMGATRVDHERLAAWVSATIPADAERTAYEGIARVRSGTALRWAPGRPIARRTLAIAPDRLDATDPHAIAMELRTRITASVRRAIDGVPRGAVLASGGLDSSAVLAAAIAEARGAGTAEIKAIALDFGGGWGDDRPYLRSLADALGIVPVRVTPAQAARFVRSTLVIDGAPTASPNAATNAVLHHVAREHGADVILSGHGGDDLFIGNLEVFADEARAGHVLRAARGVLDLSLSFPLSPARRILDFIVKPIVRGHIPDRLLRARRRRQIAHHRSWAGPRMHAFLRALVDRTPPRPDPHTSTEAASVAALASSAYLTTVADGRAMIEAFAGTEQRDPLLDDDVARLVAAIPSRVMHHDHRLRGLYRLALPAAIPDRVRLRATKAAFAVSLRQMFDAAGGCDALADLASVDHLAAMGLVDAASYRAAFDRLGASDGDGAPWRSLWPALSVEAFLREHASAPTLARPLDRASEEPLHV